jgi:hypothetical protein
VNFRVFSSFFVRFRVGGRTKSGQDSALSFRNVEQRAKASFRSLQNKNTRSYGSTPEGIHPMTGHGAWLLASLFDTVYEARGEWGSRFSLVHHSKLVVGGYRNDPCIELLRVM